MTSVPIETLPDVLPQPLEVNVAHEGTSLLGPVLIAVGAIVASGLTAGLTVFTANRRHRAELAQDRRLQAAQLKHDRNLRERQLEQDRDLRAAQLEHDARRLSAQLRHDREMRHRQGVQVLLDAALERERNVRHAAWSFVEDVEQYEEQRQAIEFSETSSDPLDAEVKLTKIRTELMKKSVAIIRLRNECLSDLVILRVRMGNHDVVEKFEVVLDAIAALHESASSSALDEDRIRNSTEKLATGAAEENLTAAQAAFLVACSGWISPNPESTREAPSGNAQQSA